MDPAPHILIVKVGRTLDELRRRRGDFEEWILSGAGLPPGRVRVVNVRAGEALPDLDGPPGPIEAVRAVIVTGSHALVTARNDWSERTGVWLRRVVERGIPALGICYGHQLLAQALGGEVSDAPGGGEFGTVTVRLTADAQGDPLLEGAPGSFPAHVAHTQSVARLPDGAVRLAESDREPHQAVRFAHRVWGVQFHPEFDAEIALAYVRDRRRGLGEAGEAAHEPELPQDGGAGGETPLARSLLGRFVALVDRARPGAL